MSFLVPAGTFQREIQTAHPNPASPGKGLGPVAMEALWQPEPRSSGLALGLSRGPRGSQSCDQIDTSVQGPVWTPETWCQQEELTEIPGGRSWVSRWLTVTLTPSISPPFSTGREKVQSVLKSEMLSHLPRFPSLILKHQLHFQVFPLRDLNVASSHSGNSTAPDPLTGRSRLLPICFHKLGGWG